MKIPKNTGIILFGYNRPSHLMRTLISLEDYKIKHVNFFLDGPRNDKDVILQKEITTIIKNTKQSIKFKFFKSKKNKGIAGSIEAGIDKLCKKYKNLIILEDDCIPRKEFFSFMIKMLNSKIYNKKIGAICGYQFPKIHDQKSSNLYPLILNYFIPWGWAIKSKQWRDYRKKSYLKNNKNKSDSNILKNLKKLKKIKKNGREIWSLNFIIYNFIKNYSFIFPSKSLVKNIGFDGSGVNSKLTSQFNTFYTSTKKIVTNKIIKNKKVQKTQEKILLSSIKYFY